MKKILSLIMVLIFAFTLASCGEEKEKVYVQDSEILNVLQSPDDYKGKYIVFNARISQILVNGDETTLQVYTPYDDFKDNALVTIYNSSETYIEDEYITIDGKINGSQKYENMFGEKLKSPGIEAETIKKTTYMEAVRPAIKTIDVWQTIDHGNAPMTLEKVEFAEKETRVYVTFENHRGETYSLYTYSPVIVQNDTQFDLDYSNYEGDYPELNSEVVDGVKTSGILTFPAIDQNSDFMFRISGNTMSDWDEQTYDFYVPANPQ